MLAGGVSPLSRRLQRFAALHREVAVSPLAPSLPRMRRCVFMGWHLAVLGPAGGTTWDDLRHLGRQAVGGCVSCAPGGACWPPPGAGLLPAAESLPFSASTPQQRGPAHCTRGMSVCGAHLLDQALPDRRLHAQGNVAADQLGALGQRPGGPAAHKLRRAGRGGAGGV